MLKNKRVDITGGPIFKSILIYAIPIILGSFVQVAFNAVDLAVVGNMADETAVASVGATSVIITLLVTSFIGLSAGVSTVLARCLGQNDNERVPKIVSTAMVSSLVLSVFVAALCFSLSKPMLSLMGCPEKCFDGALVYLRIYILGIPALMIYNFGVSVIRTTGDSERPFVYIVLSGLLNVVLNLVLCLILEQKVAAVAIATVASQYLGAFLTLMHLSRIKGSCSFSFKNITFSFNELWSILKIGGPCAFNTALFSLSGIPMSSAINSYGVESVAGNSTANTLEGFASSFCAGFSSAVVPFVGQNVGSCNRDRVKKSILYCAILSVTVSLVLTQGIFLFRNQILGIYLPNNAIAVDVAIKRMKCVLLFYPMASLFAIFTSTTQALGYSSITMICNLCTDLVFRLVWLWFIYPVLDAKNRTIVNVYSCYTVSWFIAFVIHTTVFIIVYGRYLRGRVKKI